MQQWTTGQIARAVGLSRERIAWLVRAGVICPAVRGAMHAVAHHFDLCDALGVALFVHLRRNGFDATISSRVCHWITSQTLDSLRAAFLDGRHVLIAVGTGEPFPELVSADDLAALNGGLRRAIAAGLPVCLVDVKAALEQLEVKLAMLPEARTPKAERIPCFN